MARPTNTAQRRAQIVDALRRVMARRGYDGASVVGIARAAGLTPGLFHYHFGSKREALLALAGRLADVVWERFRRRSKGAQQDPWEKLGAYIDAHVGLGPDADPAAMACWVGIGAESLQQKDVREVYRRVIAQDLAVLRGLLGDVLRREGRPTRHVTDMAAGLVAAIQGAYQLGCSAPGAIPKGSAAPMLKRMAEGLIAAEGGGKARR